MKILMVISITLLLAGCPFEDDDNDVVMPPMQAETCYQLEQVNGQYSVVADGVRVRMVDANGQPVDLAPTWTLRRREFVTSWGEENVGID